MYRFAKVLVLGVLLFVITAAIPSLGYADHGGSNSPKLTVLGQFNPFGGVDNLTTDVWALGNYAYIGSFYEPFCSLDITGVRIIDISDPTSPAQVAFIPAARNTRNNDVKVAHLETRSFSGDVLAVSNEDCFFGFLPKLMSSGFQPAGPPGKTGVSLYDVSNPANPHALALNFGNYPVHNTFIYQQGSKAFMLVVDDINARDLHIVDISKPQAPKEIANVGAPDWPGLRDNIGIGEVFLHDVWVQENDGKFIAYLSYWDAGLVLLDITNPRNPIFLGDSEYPDPDPLSGVAPEGNSHVAVPNAAGNLVLMGDEDFLKGQITSADFDGSPFVAIEGEFTFPVGLLPQGTFSGRVVWTGGEGCTTAEIPAAPASGAVALIQRGTCFFQDKAESAFAQGYAGFIVANDAARGDALVIMAARDDGPYPPIPGVFVGFSTGESMKVAPVGELGGTVTLTGVFDGVGRLHVLDVSNPSNIKDVGAFATENVFAAQPSGDRTMHNVVVDGTRAYISWYAEGMRVIDFSNPRKPKEIAHFVAPEGSDFWGVYLHTLPNGQQVLLGSDRDSGLWIFDVP